MPYLKDKSGNIYYEAYDSPSLAFTPEEWVIEKARLLSELTLKINKLQTELDIVPEPIEVFESYPNNVKEIIQEYNDALFTNEADYVLNQITTNQLLLSEIEAL